jgi:hypothetical protein
VLNGERCEGLILYCNHLATMDIKTSIGEIKRIETGVSPLFETQKRTLRRSKSITFIYSWTKNRRCGFQFNFLDKIDTIKKNIVSLFFISANSMLLSFKHTLHLIVIVTKVHKCISALTNFCLSKIPTKEYFFRHSFIKI